LLITVFIVIKFLIDEPLLASFEQRGSLPRRTPGSLFGLGGTEDDIDLQSKELPDIASKTKAKKSKGKKGKSRRYQQGRRRLK
jgi:hypothetical protein